MTLSAVSLNMFNEVIYLGEKDISEKQLEEYSDVFADIVNVLLFDGDKVVDPNDLSAAKTFSAYQSKTDNIRKLERYVAKYWNKGNIHIAYVGLENQSNAFEFMPIRIIGYDGTVYRDALNKASSKDKAITKADLFPVVTLVLYFGYKSHWNKPLSLKDCFDIPERLKPYVSDYRINLFEIAWLSDETIAKFQSDFKFVAEYFSQMRKMRRWQPMPKPVAHVKELIDFFSAVTTDNRFLDVFETMEVEKLMPSEALDYIFNDSKAMGMAQGRVEGREEGRAEERLNSIRHLMTNLKWSAKQAMDALSIPESEQTKYLALI